MKAVKNFVCFIVAILVLSAATSAYAATYTFSNSLNIWLDVAMVYVDTDTGVLTTEGWWHIEPNSEIIINVYADESHDVYYVAYNNNQYFDSNTPVSPDIKRWVRPNMFTYTTDGKPDDGDVWQGVFYKITGQSINIDTSELPSKQPEQNTAELEPVSVQPEQNTAELEPVSVQPEQVTADIEPVSVQPEQNTAEIEPVSVQPEQNTAELEPVSVQPEQVTADIDPVSVQPEQVTADIEPKTQKKVTESSGADSAGNANNSETIGDRLSTEYLSDEDLSGASKELLYYMRNRIYANHGYVFKTPKLRDEFSRHDWYKPNPDFSTKLFNKYESENLRKIIAEEKLR